MAAIIAIVIYLSIAFAALIGWVMNIFTVFSNFDLFSTGEAIVRVCGIFIPIVGAIAGWF